MDTGTSGSSPLRHRARRGLHGPGCPSVLGAQCHLSRVPGRMESTPGGLCPKRGQKRRGDAHLYDLSLVELSLFDGNAPRDGAGETEQGRRTSEQVRSHEGLQTLTDMRQSGCPAADGTVGSLPFQATTGPGPEVRVSTESVTPKVRCPRGVSCHQAGEGDQRQV